jgi:glutamyl/glutaminyl-tRNA synthetase
MSSARDSLQVDTSLYRGRLAPSPTGYLHLGHARTFWVAQERARQKQGILVLRNEDLDGARCRPEFVQAMFDDLRWFGLQWQEGPDCGGPCGPYDQSGRLPLYREALDRLIQAGHLYPCTCSRKDILQALGAPHDTDEEPVYPGTCRNQPVQTGANRKVTWRFRVRDGYEVLFVDGGSGAQRFVAGHDFGDFVVWRQDDLPAYHLAVVVDDHAMGITEVVRGADLLRSTARHLLLYDAFDWPVPRYFHCPLLTDEHGVRLAKRHDVLSLRALRAQGATPGQLLERILPDPGAR